MSELIGRRATELVALIRAGEVSPADLVEAHLRQIDRVDPKVNAWQVVRAELALAEAKALARRRRSFARLPLAGLPVAIKDNVPVAGEPMRDGTLATPAGPQAEDHPVVQKIRAAGGVILGLTRCPELCVFGSTDGPWGITRNPWDLERTPGGSSGGTAVAVATAMVPVGHGNDGMGSIRIPCSCCGLFGLKPGEGVIEGKVGGGWHGLAENGPIATSVDDGALLLSVMAARPEWASVDPPEGPLRIAVSVKAPTAGGTVDAEWKRAARETAEALAAAGHRVSEATPPYSPRMMAAAVARWTAGTVKDADLYGIHQRDLEPRIRRHAALGRSAIRRGWVKAEGRERWRGEAGAFFERHDVLITPGLAHAPKKAAQWGSRSWLANILSDSRYAPFAAPWNLAGWPAAAVPAGMHATAGTPLAVQLVAPAGGEPLLLSVAKLLEDLRPWPRHAPLAAAASGTP
ncbi:MAG: amidase [Actinobacteria bacterium]|nr:amidase [Actinomycetota bacterium]